MEKPRVVETIGLLQPFDRDPFLIGLSGPPSWPTSPDVAYPAAGRDVDRQGLAVPSQRLRPLTH